MILGTYPCCDEPLMLEVPGGMSVPIFAKEECPACSTTVWHKLSRFDPKSWTEEGFLEEFEVNHDTCEIKKKEEKI